MSWRRCSALLAAVSLLVPATGAMAQEVTAEDLLASGELLVRARLEPDGEAWVGQQVSLFIEVLTATWFRSAPDYSELRVPGAIALLPERFGTNFVERIGGRSYSGQRRRFVIYPQRAGRFTVPSLSITLTTALPQGGVSPPLELRSPELQLTARVPEAAAGLDAFVTTSRLTVAERYDRGLDDLKVGDSLKRTITLTAEASLGLLLPALEFPDLDGVGVYVEEPRVEDDIYRGRYSGTRVESVTYMFEREGAYLLPEIPVHWWDLDAGELRTDKLSAVELMVEPNPDLDPEQAAAGIEEAPASGFERLLAWLILRWQPPTALVLALCLVGLLLRRYAGAWRVRRRERRRRRADAESAYFRRFRQASLRGDAPATLTRLLAWLDRWHPGDRAATIDALAAASGDPDLDRQAKALSSLLFARPASLQQELAAVAWSGRRLYRAVARLRRRRGGRQAAEDRRRGLKPLNPRPSIE